MKPWGGAPKAQGLYPRRQHKEKRGSSTTGKSKGLVPTPEERVFAGRSRSYKLRGYGEWAHRTWLKNHGNTRTN